MLNFSQPINVLVTLKPGNDEEVKRVFKIDIRDGALVLEGARVVVCYAPGEWKLFVTDSDE